MRLLIRWFINAGTLLALAYYLPGIEVTGWYSALVAALTLGLVNAVIRPILIFFTLPINILTLGLFVLVINAILFWFVGTLIQGFTVDGFWPAFIGALVLTLVSWVTNSFLKKDYSRRSAYVQNDNANV